jgi:hypothetical protein
MLGEWGQAWAIEPSQEPGVRLGGLGGLEGSGSQAKSLESGQKDWARLEGSGPQAKSLETG